MMKGTRFSGEPDVLIAVEGVELSAFVNGIIEPLKRIQLLPMGEARIRDGRRLKVTTEDIDRVITAFDEQVNDVAFLVQHGDLSWEACGWIKKLEKTPKGLFADVEWLPEMALKIQQKKYRYSSPNIKFRKDEDGFMRPLYLLEGSATNVPAIDGMDELAASALPSFQPPTPRTLHTMTCAACGREFKGSHKDGCAALCDKDTSKHSDEGIDHTKGKEAMDEARFKQLEENITKLTETVGKIAEGTAKLAEAKPDMKILAAAVVTEALPALKEEAKKDAEARFAAIAKVEKFDGILKAAELEGRLTSAQRESFAACANGDPEKAEKFVATLPKPEKGALGSAAKDPKLSETDGEGTDHTERAARLTQIARFAADNAMSMVEAEEFLTQKDVTDAAKIAAAAKK